MNSAGFLLPDRRMKEVVTPNTLTFALELGRVIREAREAGENIPESIIS